MSQIVRLKDIVVRFYTYEGVVKALEKVNLFVKKGETLGLVGETGCGKTMTGLSIFNLIPSPGRIEGGEVLFRTKEGRIKNLLSLDEAGLQRIRGAEISMIFQEPSASLNPVYTIGDQVSEVFLTHREKALLKNTIKKIDEELQESKGELLKRFILRFEKNIYERIMRNKDPLLIRILNKIPLIRRYRRRLEAEAKKQAISLLRDLGIPDPERVADMYPYELSGGMQQRAVIAMALACNPVLLVADEPTTSLDVTIQARILELIRELKRRFDTTVLFITHDLGVIAEMCDRVAVMYAGNVVEIADVKEIFRNPLHPYTKALMESIPQPGKEYKTIRGVVPNLINPPSGCRFHPRCPQAVEICAEKRPELLEIRKDHFVACHLYDGEER
ncbi:ABC transporter ATP-binding protein [Candidatus Bathyarchaeota archaeon]|nr:MAG: ABC transporter ATP-binding protein [Candidatus Bathyarchaeota archaeon]